MIYDSLMQDAATFEHSSPSFPSPPRREGIISRVTARRGASDFPTRWRRFFLPMNLLFGVPRLRGPDRLKAELQTRSRIHRFQGFNARNFSWNSLPEERLPRTSARLAPLNRVAANVGRASRLPSLRVRANEVVPAGAGERDRLKTLSSEGRVTRVTRVPDFFGDFRPRENQAHR